MEFREVNAKSLEKTENVLKKLSFAAIEKLPVAELNAKQFAARCPDPKAAKFDFLDIGPIRAPVMALRATNPPVSKRQYFITTANRKCKSTLPDGCWDDAYSLFGFFWRKHVWQVIADHINAYALVQGAEDEVLARNTNQCAWYRAALSKSRSSWALACKWALSNRY